MAAFTASTWACAMGSANGRGSTGRSMSSVGLHSLGAWEKASANTDGRAGFPTASGASSSESNCCGRSW
uniref:Putative secreted protein n=1 Tax=Ixodes ricinus TaxID=34613 RepID=A0A6B0TT53_IXORI